MNLLASLNKDISPCKNLSLSPIGRLAYYIVAYLKLLPLEPHLHVSLCEESIASVTLVPAVYRVSLRSTIRQLRSSYPDQLYCLRISGYKDLVDYAVQEC
ncbi:hypothetical protein Tco_0026765 [Tanacetum coccineum]